MIGAAVIVLREVFEAALIVGIVLAATQGVARRGLWIAAGIALGVLGAVVVAGFADRIANALEGVGQEVFNAGVLLAATLMLGWHNVWMQRHGAALAREMRDVGREVTTGRSPLSFLLLVVGLAVLREGSEVVLFLYGIAAGGAGAGELLAGSLLGLAGGVAIGAALYHGLLRIPARHLFGVTAWLLLLLLAAGMAAQGAGFLVQAGKLPALAEPVWDASAVLPEHGALGQVLHALVGYAERPSGMQLVFFLVVAVAIGVLTKRVDRSPRPSAARAVAVAAAIALGAAALAPAPVRAAHVIYSPIVEEGELALEWRAHRDFDSRESLDGAEQHKLDLEYSPTARWRTELFGEWEKEPGESLRATEIAWENIFQLTEQGRYFADFGVLAEYAHSLVDGGEDAIELGMLAEKQLARSIVTVNVLAERELESGAETQLEYAARWRWRLSERFEPGIELHGELGDWGAFGRLEEHTHELGPAMLGRLRTASGAGAFRYEAAVLFGLTHDSPDTTLRLQLEWEF